MKFIAIAAASTLLFAGAVNAQQMRAQAGAVYGEIGYSQMKIDNGVNSKPGLLRGVVGYEFHPNVAVEALAGFGVNKSGETVNYLGTNVNVEQEVRSVLGVYVKPKVDLGAVELYGRLGYARTKLKVTASVAGASASGSDSGSDVSYGLGAAFKINPSTSISVDWMSYYNKDDTKIQGVNVGLGFRF